MTATQAYRTLFVGTLVQESFLSVGGTDDPWSTVDSPFCRDGLGRPTLRGSGLAGALIATLRRIRGKVPAFISGSADGRQPSVWRFFHSHPAQTAQPAFRQHVAIHAETGAAAEGALFNIETLPPGTRWPFLLEIDTARASEAESLARQALAEWQLGRCWLGREVARGLGWLRLDDLRAYVLDRRHIDRWPHACAADAYCEYIAATFAAEQEVIPPPVKGAPLLEIGGRIVVGPRSGEAAYGLDSLSVGGHASDDLSAEWDRHFLAPEGQAQPKESFDPDQNIVSYRQDGQCLPYLPGSSLRGPLRHALSRLRRARGQDLTLVERLFGDCEKASARLLIKDALPEEGAALALAWLQHHAEDEFTAGAHGCSKFDRVAVLTGCFVWKMVVEGTAEELRQFYDEAIVPLLALVASGQIGLGGGQWRGHGWARWQVDTITKPWEDRT